MKICSEPLNYAWLVYKNLFALNFLLKYLHNPRLHYYLSSFVSGTTNVSDASALTTFIFDNNYKGKNVLTM